MMMPAQSMRGQLGHRARLSRSCLLGCVRMDAVPGARWDARYHRTAAAGRRHLLPNGSKLGHEQDRGGAMALHRLTSMTIGVPDVPPRAAYPGAAGLPPSRHAHV